MPAARPNHLYYGDNLDVLQRYIASESVDLVYLDPPFNSNATYNVLFAEQDGTRSSAQIKAFEDTWRWDQRAVETFQTTVSRGGPVSDALRAFYTLLGDSNMMAYLAMMAPRLVELRRVLKPTGSLYLHCDPTASHYLKLLLDAIFEPQNFLSEVAWKRTGTHSSARRWGPVHDTLLVYAKSAGRHTWNRPYSPLAEGHRQRHYRMVDERGRPYTHGELTAPGRRHGRSGETWRGFDVTAIGRHWCTTVDKLDQLASEGRIYFPPDNGWPRLIRYLDESKGRAIGDVWEDIPPLNMKANERLGYPTQKPVALLERILKASSNDGEVVLDPFCGCGTAIAAAQKLGRRWIGIDITHIAINLIKTRLRDAYGDEIAETYDVVGEPTTLTEARALAAEDRYQFQWWALGLVGARMAEVKKGADRGIDGRLFFYDYQGAPKQIILSVKSGGVGVKDVRELQAVIDREKAAIGALITLEPATAPMRAEAAAGGWYEPEGWGGRYPRLQIATIAELLDGRKLDYPARGQRGVTFKQAPREKTAEGQQAALAL